MKTFVIILLAVFKLILFLAGVWGFLAILIFLGGGIRDAVEYGKFQVLGFFTILGIWFLYCMVSVLGIIRWRWLLKSGILMQLALVVTMYFYYAGIDLGTGTTYFKIAGVFALLWWLHFAAQYYYETTKTEASRIVNG